METNSSAKTLKILSLVFIIFNIIFALAAFLAFVSGMLILLAGGDFFTTGVSAEAAANIQEITSPLTLVMRLASGVAYVLIIIHCFKNRKKLPEQVKELVELPYLIGIIVTPVMLVFNLVSTSQLQVTAFIFPLIFTGLYIYAFKLTKDLKN